MTIRSTRWPAGIPCWADLQTPDVLAIEEFYGPLLGWSFINDDTGEYGGYAIAQRQDVAAAGIGPMQVEGIPSTWTMYFASDDADATAQAITANGGQVVLPVGDVGELGRLCVALDPTGAPFGIWEAKAHIGANITAEPGALTWEDLRTPDPDRARTFYASVFGFEFTELPGAGPSYTTFGRAAEPELPMGGIGDMMGQDDAPPHWLVYFAVENTVAAAEQVKSLGGSVISGPFETPYGAQATVLDPAGATLCLIQIPEGTPVVDR